MGFRAQISCWILLCVLLYVHPSFAGQVVLDENDHCPNPSSSIVYSPFKPYWYFYPSRDGWTVQDCWRCAGCLFIRADEPRKQQFSATALIMGLLPLTLKDIAWPERRQIRVSAPLGKLRQIIVLALGLEPVAYPKVDDEGGDRTTGGIATTNSGILRRMCRLSRGWVIGGVVACSLGLLVSYGCLAVVEIFSKRSALGCVYPIFALTWYSLASLLPATAHTILSSLRIRRADGRQQLESEESGSSSSSTEPGVKGANSSVHRRSHNNQEDHANRHASYPGNRESQTCSCSRGNGPAPKRKGISAVQGGDEWWPVQLTWAIYYIAGTLIFTSIMAVTIVELTVWVFVCFLVTGASKALAAFICLEAEKRQGFA